jgi:arylsulfatase A-like enzyme/Tfp pilus assembly protein PilF
VSGRFKTRVWSIVAAAVACAIAAHGCAKPAVVREAGLNVLLITIDTLRADAVGAYGNAKAETPWIDRLAAGGVRFSQAHAQTVVTLPSHANILAGRYPFRHGVRENAGFRFPPDMDTLATRLKALGYRTGAFVSAFPLDVRFGLGLGFDVYDDRYGKGAEKRAFRVPERRGADTVAAALEWIGTARQSAPWFAWVHLYEPHFPYTPPEPFASRFADAPYLGECAAADAALAPLVGPILDQGASGRTLIVVTGDHGESLGEHGEMSHGLFAYEATLRVPLVVFAPRLLKPRVVDEPVRHVDILPTVLDALGSAPPSDIDGRSLLAMAATGEASPAPSYFEALSASLNRGWAPLFGISRGTLKYIDLPIPELYDLASDPAEAHNLAASRPAELRELQNLLAPLRAADRGPSRSAESAETRERLRSLGYVTATPALKTRFTEADDPKRLIAVDRAIDEVVTRYQGGDLRGAIALAEDVVRQRPDMPLAFTHLAFLYNEAGEHRKAAGAIRRALELNPAAEDVAALLGAYLTEAGLPGEAVARLAPYAGEPRPDVDVLIAYGVAVASTGRMKEALAAFERARALDAANALPLVDIGTVYMMSGDRDRAEAALTQALRLDPATPRAHNGLGVIAAERGRSDEAIAHWRQALALDPHDHQALYNLGDLLIRLGRSAEGRSYWERYVQDAPAGIDARDVTRVRQWLLAHRP